MYTVKEKVTVCLFVYFLSRFYCAKTHRYQDFCFLFAGLHNLNSTVLKIQCINQPPD